MGWSRTREEREEGEGRAAIFCPASRHTPAQRQGGQGADEGLERLGEGEGAFPSKGTPEMSEVLPVQSPLIAGATPLLPPGEARVRD